MQTPPPASDRQYNNADSYAQAFDNCWNHLIATAAGRSLDQDARLEAVIERISEHPFALSEPAMARQVAAFRIRLLGL